MDYQMKKVEWRLSPPFNIEIIESGVWFGIDRFDSFISALHHASNYSELFGSDNKVRIIDNNGKII